MTRQNELDAEYVKRVTAQLTAMGYVVLKIGTEVKITEVRMEDAHDERDTKQRWLEKDIFPYQRHLTNRVDHLAGLAFRLGATPEQLASASCPCGLSQCRAGKP